jgi:ATP-dependent helicase/nuclease subunit B
MVPEQYSHEAERELAENLGDGASRFAEVLTFTRLASRVFVECGGLNLPAPDKPAKILIMRLAYGAVAERLKVYGGQNAKTEFLIKLLEIREEFVTCKITPDSLWDTAELSVGTLKDKLYDLAMICGAYDAELSRRYEDSRDKLTRLAELIGSSAIGDRGIMRFEGFSDFTKQQLDIISELLKKGADLAFVLATEPASETDYDDEILSIPRATERALAEIAGRFGVDVEYENPEENSNTEVEYSLYSAADIASECEMAASLVTKWLSEDETLSPTDIAVVAPGFSGAYEAVCGSVFGKRGVPFYLSRKDDILQKAVMTLVTEAFGILSGGWRYEQIFRYVKTNLTGVEYADELENYVLVWNIKGVRRWSEPWQMNPRGYIAESEYTDADIARLERVETSRKSVAEPLIRLRERGKAAKSAKEQAFALYQYLDEIALADRLEKKAESFILCGEEKLAAEYAQLWEVVITALETVFDVLGDTPMEQEEFGKLFTLLLAQYDLGTIPAALNRVRLGDLESVRETPASRLIIMGASDTAMPDSEPSRSLLSADERKALAGAGLEIEGDFETNLRREYYLIGRVLAKPREALAAMYLSGERISWLVKAVLGDTEETEITVKPGAAVRRNPDAVRVSPASVTELYGEWLTLTASRVEDFNSCKFMYFMKFGMKAKARKTAELDAPEFGTLVHYVLENVTREVNELGGFAVVEQNKIKSLAGAYVSRYAEERIRKSVQTGRFLYLFERLRDSVINMTAYIAEELANSNFVPSDFEREVKDVQFGGVTISGVIDRVDALNLGDTLYLRVADYKTGSKKFALSEVYYGLGMQMLIYLFALTGGDVKPAGVHYTPARDVLMSMPRGSSDEAIEKKRRSALKGSGIILDELLRESEVKAASLEQMGKLAKLVEIRLGEVGEAIRSGNAEPDPFTLKASRDPCEYCDYGSVCGLIRNPEDKRKLATLSDAEFWAACGD